MKPPKPKSNLDSIALKLYPSFMNRQRTVFKTLGVILFAPLSLSWQLLNQFLLSPWGLVVPMTLLIALLAVLQIQKTPEQLALFYAEQFETCDEAEIPRLIRVLVQMGDPGVPGLVKGLTSNREVIFSTCLYVLQHEFDRWQESERREHHFRIFSEALLQACHHFSPAAQAEAMRFVDQMMQVRSIAASSESTADRQQMIAHCGQILSQLESMRRRRIEPSDKAFEPPKDTVASLHQRARQPVLLASNGQPFMPTSVRQERSETFLADADNINPFSVPRADRLLAYQRSQQNRPAESRDNPRLPDDREMFGIASFASPSAFAAEIEQHIARNFSPDDFESAQTFDISPIDISEEYRNQKQSESSGTFGSDNFLSPELQDTPLDRVPNLPTTQLMQLLHHPRPAYIESARRTLTSRDGFQEAHLNLAWRLYHPIPAVRQEIVAMLPHTANVQPSVWLTVLLSDPNNEVRHRAASFLATTTDPVLQRLLIDRGKRDSDARIVNLAERLNESQRTVRR